MKNEEVNPPKVKGDKGKRDEEYCESLEHILRIKCSISNVRRSSSPDSTDSRSRYSKHSSSKKSSRRSKSRDKYSSRSRRSRSGSSVATRYSSSKSKSHRSDSHDRSARRRHSRDRHRRSHSRDKRRSRDSVRSRDRGRSRDKDRSKDRDRPRKKDRSRERETSRDRQRSRRSRSRSYIKEYVSSKRRSTSASSSSSSEKDDSKSQKDTKSSIKRKGNSDVEHVGYTVKEDSSDCVIVDSKTIDEINKNEFAPKEFSSSKSKKVPDNILINLNRQTIKVPAVEPLEPDSIFHHNLFLNEEARMEKWVKELYSYRQKALMQGSKTNSH